MSFKFTAMKSEKHKNLPNPQEDNEAEITPGYPVYPASEDIYNNSEEEEEINPESISKTKTPNEKNRIEIRNEKDFNSDKSGDDLDVPGAELDDEAEMVGSEDEENNYYSIGGDAHNDLEEST